MTYECFYMCLFLRSFRCSVKDVIGRILDELHVIDSQSMFGFCKYSKPQNSAGTQLVDTPFQIRLLKSVGLQQFLFQKFVFRRKTPTYEIKSEHKKQGLYLKGERYLPPSLYQVQTQIIQSQNHNIPLVRLRPIFDVGYVQDKCPCIIYAHGNSSDVGDALQFVDRMAQVFKAQYVLFDYTGYGQSQLNNVTEQSICSDLQIVLNWTQKKHKNIILWGFSLGTYPVVMLASRFSVGGVILQCPIGSLSCMFYEQYEPNVRFKEDHFASIDHISRICSPLLIMHGTNDQIIPVQQARLLYQKYVAVNGNKNVAYLQIEQLTHNGFHRYLVSNRKNQIQTQALNFLNTINSNINKNPEPIVQIYASKPIQHEFKQRNIYFTRKTNRNPVQFHVRTSATVTQTQWKDAATDKTVSFDHGYRWLSKN